MKSEVSSSTAALIENGRVVRAMSIVRSASRNPRVSLVCQRADLDMSRLPDFLWLRADRLVRDCLDDVATGKVVSVPGLQYKVLTGALQVLPRGLVRRASGTIASLRRRRG